MGFIHGAMGLSMSRQWDLSMRGAMTGHQNCYCLLTEVENKQCLLTGKILVSIEKMFFPQNISFILIFKNKYFQTHGLQFLNM